MKNNNKTIFENDIDVSSKDYDPSLYIIKKKLTDFFLSLDKENKTETSNQNLSNNSIKSEESNSSISLFIELNRKVEDFQKGLIEILKSSKNLEIENESFKKKLEENEKRIENLNNFFEEFKTKVKTDKVKDLLQCILLFLIIIIFLVANLKIIDESIEHINNIIYILNNNEEKIENKYLQLLKNMLLWATPILLFYFLVRLLREFRKIYEFFLKNKK